MYLDATGQTQAEFAATVGLTQATVSKLCRGKLGLKLATAFRIERATGGAVPVSAWVDAA
jgi:plasmid maintenance system antidote protein VapI